MPPKRATVYVADDHPLFRDGVTRAIKERPDLDLIGEAADGRSALEAIRELRPAVALLDVRMPELDGLEVLNAITRDELATAVVLLSAHMSSDLVYRSIAMGAAAYLPKESTREEICDAVAAAARGETRLPPDVQTVLVRQMRVHAARERPQLTEREQQVLALIGDGMSAPDIATQLHLSTATVKSHLLTLYEKLGVSDRAHAVATAMRQGLLE
jgi:two-component system nitrate/nitrite response regulator NarL